MGLTGKSGTLRAALVVMAVLAALSLTTCGGGKHTTNPPSVGSGGQTQHRVAPPFQAVDDPSIGNGVQTQHRVAPPIQAADSLDEVLAELDALEIPDGVDAALFAQLKDALREALNDSCKAGIIVSGAGVPPVIQVVRRRDACATKLISTPPTGEANRVDDLELTDNGDGTFTLSWSYKNVGDYDQNGTVAIEDVIPLAEHYNETWAVGEEDTLPAVIDGSGNGRVGIEDITPLAINLETKVAKYVFEVSESVDGQWGNRLDLPLALANGEGRLRFSTTFDRPEGTLYMRVVPYETQGTPGIPSETLKYPNRGDWWMFGRNPQHTGCSPYGGPQYGDRVKRIPVTSFSSSPAIGADGSLYTGGAFLWGNAADLSHRWLVSAEGKCVGSPALGSDGTVYANCNDQHLYAVAPDGRVKWRYETGGEAWSSPAIGSDGTIYVGSNDDCLYALNVLGELQWKYQTEGDVDSSPAVRPDGVVCFTSSDGYLYAVSPDGDFVWRTDIGCNDSSPTIAEDGTVYAGGRGSLIAVCPDGTVKWEYPIGGYVDSCPAIGVDGTVYITCWEGSLYAFTDAGSEGILNWSYQTGDNLQGGPAVGADGTIYFGSFDQWFYALDPNGTLKWRYQTRGLINGSPAIAENGTVYISSHDGYLYAFADEAG